VSFLIVRLSSIAMAKLVFRSVDRSALSRVCGLDKTSRLAKIGKSLPNNASGLAGRLVVMAGSRQTRSTQTVINDLNFCIIRAAFTSIYSDRIKVHPQRRHIMKG